MQASIENYKNLGLYSVSSIFVEDNTDYDLKVSHENLETAKQKFVSLVKAAGFKGTLELYSVEKIEINDLKKVFRDTVHSFTHPDKWYTVSFYPENDTYTCDCPHFLHRLKDSGDSCKHISYALSRGFFDADKFGYRGN